jgi:DNA-binding transcriptional LysR family regulator
LDKTINVDQLRTFALVAETGSFSGAAGRLRLTQPAVSLQVRQLERSLGATLIERVGRRARPTAIGLELLGHAAKIDAAIASAIEAVEDRASSISGAVRLGTGATASIYLLPAVLGGLKRRFPDLEITVTTGNTVDIARALEANRIDIALATMPIVGRILAVTPVLIDPFVLIAPIGMILPSTISPKSLSNLPVLLFEPDGNTGRITNDWFSKNGLTLRPAMSLGSVEAIKEMVRARLGCAVIPNLAVKSEDPRRGLAVHPLRPALSRRLALAVRRDKRLDRGLKETLAAITSACAEHNIHGA